jgi:hypothetical protein
MILHSCPAVTELVVAVEFWDVVADDDAEVLKEVVAVLV